MEMITHKRKALKAAEKIDFFFFPFPNDKNKDKVYSHWVLYNWLLQNDRHCLACPNLYSLSLKRKKTDE